MKGYTYNGYGVYKSIRWPVRFAMYAIDEATEAELLGMTQAIGHLIYERDIEFVMDSVEDLFTEPDETD